jgi:hypothetical protein
MYNKLVKHLIFPLHEKKQAIDDFKVLPLLSKEEIRKNLDDMKWKDSLGDFFSTIPADRRESRWCFILTGGARPMMRRPGH